MKYKAKSAEIFPESWFEKRDNRYIFTREGRIEFEKNGERGQGLSARKGLRDAGAPQKRRSRKARS